MRQFGLLILCLLLGSAVALSGASAREYKCPEHIEVTSTEIKPVSGFTAWNDPQVKFFVTGVDLYEGPPQDIAQLKPDNADDMNEAAPSNWLLTDSAKGFWMVCLYSDTSARIAKQLDAHETSCTVKDVRGPEDTTSGISLDCK